jgi:hypothetical protein
MSHGCIPRRNPCHLFGRESGTPVIVFASVTAVAMFVDRISTKTSVGVLTYFGAVIMYLVYLFGYGRLRVEDPIRIIGAHVVCCWDVS